MALTLDWLSLSTNQITRKYKTTNQIAGRWKRLERNRLLKWITGYRGCTNQISRKRAQTNQNVWQYSRFSLLDQSEKTSIWRACDCQMASNFQPIKRRVGVHQPTNVRVNANDSVTAKWFSLSANQTARSFTLTNHHTFDCESLLRVKVHQVSDSCEIFF